MQLVTERLILREFTPDDWPAVLAYQSDPLYLRYNPWSERTPEAVREFVGMFLANQEEQPRIKFQLAVLLKSGGELIGNCGIRKDFAAAHEADIGYELSPDHWGRGYAPRRRAPSCALGLLSSAFTGSGPGVRQKTPPRRTCLRKSACGPRATCAKRNSSRTAGGIPCYLPS